MDSHFLTHPTLSSGFRQPPGRKHSFPRYPLTCRNDQNHQKETAMKSAQPSPDEALVNDPLDYSDPELRAYTEEQAEDILDTVVHYMPVVLPVTAAILIFMLAFIAVFMA